MKNKVTCIGGIFFKVKDPNKTKEWYAKNLGLVTNEYGSVFEFKTAEAEDLAYLNWSPMKEDTTYFEPSKKEFMVNYRVENIEDLVAELKSNGVTILDEITSYEYGKFVNVLDPDGNNIELWEPIDSSFTRLYGGKTTK